MRRRDRVGRPNPLRALSSLRENRRFRLLWFSNLFFFGGAWTQTLVLGWLVYQVTRSDVHVAVFAAVRLAPMLLGPLAGALADRHNRVRLLMVACGCALVAATVVAVFASVGSVPYLVLLAGGLGIGLAQSPSQPPRAALVLELVGRQNLSNANALNAMAMNMTQVVGPALGGSMISAFGAPAALWISTVWFAISLVLLLPLRRFGDVAVRHVESAFGMLATGFRAVVHNRLAAAVLLITIVANVLLWPVYQSFMPVFAEESLHIGAAGLGWLLTCAGLGGLLGSVVIAGLGDFRFKGGLFVFGTAGWAALWALFGISSHLALSFVLMGAIGVCSAAFAVLQTTLLLMTTEPVVHGRVLGLLELTIGVQPIASLGVGAVAALYGIDTTTFFSGVLLVVFVLAVAWWAPQLVSYSGRDVPQE